MTKRLLTLVWATAVAAAAALAQGDSLLLRNYDLVRQADPWLTADNAAALVHLQSPTVAQATLTLTDQRGGLADYSQPARQLQGTAAVESYVRLSARTVVYGLMQYDNQSARSAGGSYFISPARKPFDLLDDSLTNQGRRHLDVYHLRGGVGTLLLPRVAVGAALDYTAANYAKYKDLRHKNQLMDLTVTAGAYSPLTPWLAVGANYRYRRATESLTFTTYGNADKVYKTLVAYAAFTGQIEQFGTTGYTEQNREQPLVDEYHGASLQVELSPVAAVQLFAELAAAHRSGYYGRPSPYTITHTDHSGDTYDGRAVLTLRRPRQLHQLAVSLSSETIENRERNYLEQVNDAGAYYYEYYAPTKNASHLWVDGRAEYTAHLGLHGETPTLTLRCSLDWQRREGTAYRYPYQRRQQLRRLCPSVGAERTWQLPRLALLTVGVDASFSQGSGAPYEDLTLAAPSEVQTPPPMMEESLLRQYEYLTSAQRAVQLSARYAFALPMLGLRPHVALTLGHAKVNGAHTHLPGSDRTTVSCAVGCLF